MRQALLSKNGGFLAAVLLVMMQLFLLLFLQLGEAEGSSSISAAITSNNNIGTSSLPSSSSIASASIASASFASIPRGGGASYFPMKLGVFGWFRQKSVAQYYRETLQDQVLLLDRQLRQAREEVNRLREQRKETATTSSSSTRLVTRKLLSPQQKSNLTGRVNTLTKQIQQLEAMKEELEELLIASATRVEELEAKLEEQEALTQEMVEKYELQIAQLRASMEEKASEQLHQLEQLMEERVSEAAEQARQAELAKVEERIQQVTKHMRADHELSLEAERKRSTKAVEAEKKKMRKLVKALAIREKKLLAKAEKDRQISGTSTTTATTSTTSNNNKGAYIQKTTPIPKPQTPPTSRGPI